VDAGAFDNLRDVEKRADLGVHRHQRGVPDLKSAMAALVFTHQIDGAARKKLFGVFVAVFLVLLDGGEVSPPSSLIRQFVFFRWSARSSSFSCRSSRSWLKSSLLSRPRKAIASLSMLHPAV